MPPAREPAPMAIPITVRGANAVASNFWEKKWKWLIKYGK